MELHTSLNTLDYVVLAIILLSGMLAIFTGFVREMYSLFNWTASAYIGSHFYRFAEPYVKNYISNPTTVMDVSIFAVFCVSFIVLGLIGSLVNRLVRGNTLTAIDRSLGFVFGLGRGLFICCLIYLVVTMVLWPDLDKPQPPAPLATETVATTTPPASDEPVKTEGGKRQLSFSAPHWVVEAKTRPLLVHGANMLKEFIPEKALEKRTEEYLDKKTEEVHDKINNAVIGKDDQPVTKSLSKE